MFKPSAKAAILSIMTAGVVLSFGMTAVRAGDNVTEDQIIKALTPEKKSLTPACRPARRPPRPS